MKSYRSSHAVSFTSNSMTTASGGIGWSVKLDPRFPEVDEQRRRELAEILEAEAPEGAAADPFEEG